MMATRYGWMADTDTKAFEVLIELERRRSAADKLQSMFDLSVMAQQLAEMGVRSQHPQANDREVFLRVAARRLDRETMIRVYGWDPKEAGG